MYVCIKMDEYSKLCLHSSLWLSPSFYVVVLVYYESLRQGFVLVDS
jgi:hypothetical protein